MKFIFCLAFLFFLRIATANDYNQYFGYFINEKESEDFLSKIVGLSCNCPCTVNNQCCPGGSNNQAVLNCMQSCYQNNHCSTQSCYDQCTCNCLLPYGCGC